MLLLRVGSLLLDFIAKALCIIIEGPEFDKSTQTTEDKLLLAFLELADIFKRQFKEIGSQHVLLAPEG